MMEDALVLSLVLFSIGIFFLPFVYIKIDGIRGDLVASFLFLILATLIVMIRGYWEFTPDIEAKQVIREAVSYDSIQDRETANYQLTVLKENCGGKDICYKSKKFYKYCYYHVNPDLSYEKISPVEYKGE